ncbi:MAG: hypothetical protein KF760_33670 [Candidatus Eremiobacteraeota bacterium]|nr:hypothetical protein [Candidatus Eremiobacteraeota bacterium]MCW5869852.1 hypothetical protein [Candidatus Eremiobacteraeota bacterium]
MRVHSVVQPAPISTRGLPGAENYRVEARQRLGDGVDERTLELAALQLYENTILARAGNPGPAPKVHPQVFQATRSLDSVAGYTAGLVGGGLGAVAVAALAGFSPTLLWEPGAEESRLKILGEPAVLDKVASELAPRFSVSFPDHEVWVTGSVRPEQRTLIGEALAQLHNCIGNEAFQQLKKVHVRPYLGQLSRSGGEIAGLAALSTPDAVFLKASQLENKEQFAGTLFHEFGHLRDARKADFWSQRYLSISPHSPFGNGGDFDFVSDYARSKPTEDLAETHRFLIENWDKVQTEPQLWIHANGDLGDKLAWVLDKFYDRAVPPLGKEMKQALKEVKRGLAPFSNREDFQEKLQQFLQKLPSEATPEQQDYLKNLRERTLHDTPAPPWWRSLFS